jgi:hypothetical protein
MLRNWNWRTEYASLTYYCTVSKCLIYIKVCAYSGAWGGVVVKALRY